MQEAKHFLKQFPNNIRPKVRVVLDFLKYLVEIEVDQARVRPWEIWHLQSDNTKLYSAIGTKIPTSLEESLKRTIQYFYDNGDKWDWKQ